MAQGKLESLAFASALEAARAIRSNEVSSVELTRHCFARISKYNKPINAMVTLTEEEAIASAQAADEAHARGQWWGPFHGVPCTVKDTFEMKGVRTTAGSIDLSDYRPTTDAPLVERLRHAGAVLVGKTNVPLFAADMQTFNAVFGTTNNPWDLTKTPGGSTGGGAAALAAGLGYLALGSDIGGSIRNPASFCGVYGHKPTMDILPTAGELASLPDPLPPAPDFLSVTGPLARSATDLRAALEVLGGPSGHDAVAYRWSLPQPRGSRPAEFRVNFVLDHPLCPVDPEVQTQIKSAVDALEKAGARVTEGWPEGIDPVEQFRSYFYILMLAYASEPDELTAPQIEMFSQAPDDNIMKLYSKAHTDPYYRVSEAFRAQRDARNRWQAFFQSCDAFILPTSFSTAFPHVQTEPLPARVIDAPHGPRPYFDHLFWISFATLAGLPATVAPVGRTNTGLPVGAQIMGPYLEDATSIELAACLAELLGGFVPPPGYA
ncbi:MAG: amidase [Candidatus Hydrogenedentota bacterium]